MPLRISPSLPEGRGEGPPRRRSSRGGFTLIEVLATLLLMAIALPAIMMGFSLSTKAASMARQRSEAGALAESKLNELVATGLWQSGSQAGAFDDQPDYQWSAEVAPWSVDPRGSGTYNVQQLDVKVSWNAPGGPESISVSTLVYQSNSTGTGITGGIP